MENIIKTNFDFIVISPGINLRNCTLGNYLKKNKHKIITDLDIFYFENPNNFKITITGTNGKSTTAKLLYEIFKNSKKDVILAGNIGLPILRQNKKSKNKSSIDKFVNSLNLFGYGYSWGGFESLALHQKIKEQGIRKYLNLSEDEHIVRLHIGLEDPKDLINDLKSSLKFIK